MQASIKESVLVVDDEPQVLIALDDLLSDQFTVFKSGSAEAALNLLDREQDIAVMVTDQRMPGVTGDELLVRIPAESDTQRILLTGYADLSAVVRAVNEGKIFAYVSKPWDPSDLLNKVMNAANQFRLARELARERELLAQLMNNVPDGVYFKDKKLKFQRVNRAFAQMMDCRAPEDLVGRTASQILSVADPESDADDLAVINGGNAVSDRIQERVGANSSRWFSETKAPVRTADGEFGLVGIVRDVTERTVAAQALSESEARLREQTELLNSILESMDEGVIVADQRLGVLLFNKTAQKILGKDVHVESAAGWAAACGLQLLDARSPLDPQSDPMLRALRGERTSGMEFRVSNDNVLDARVTVTGVPLNDMVGRRSGGVVMIRDVTDQRRLEEQLQHAQKMEAIGQLAGGIAHDFNNLLAVIMSYGQLIVHDLTTEDPRREDMRELLAAAERAAGLTQQLLTFSRLRRTNPTPLSLNEVVTNLERMLRRVLPEHLSLSTHLEPDLGTIWADAGQLEQVLLNLVVNARDATQEGGEIVISTSNVELDVLDPARGNDRQEYVTLSVKDDGTGMSAETRRRIFEPFFTTKEIGRGTGLGLSTVYAIIQQAEGHIAVESEPGEGTCFKLHFPRRRGPAETRNAPALNTDVPPPIGSVLVIEDDVALRRVSCRILRTHGYSVFEAKNATDARTLCAAQGQTIDLILTDVAMPEITGPKLVRELLTLQPKAKILFMSGYGQDTITREGLLDEDAIYLEKPFLPSTLLRKVHSVLAEAAKDSMSASP